MIVDRGWYQFCTVRQCEILKALEDHGSYKGACAELGVSLGTISNAVMRIKFKASSHGYSPEHDMTRIAPDPFVVRGTSTYYNEEGKVRGQWVKTKIDDSKVQQMMLETIEAMKEDIPRVS